MLTVKRKEERCGVRTRKRENWGDGVLSYRNGGCVLVGNYVWWFVYVCDVVVCVFELVKGRE